jgi:hypothetical protein
MQTRAELHRALLLTALVGLVCCRERPVQTRIVVVTATPAPPVVVVVAPTPEPTMHEQSATFEVMMAPPAEEPRATQEARPAQRIAERDPPPPPASLREQMEQCVTLTVSDDYGAALEGAARVRVKAKNACNVAFSWDDIWVEVTARPLSGAGVLGRTVGRLFSEIRPHGEAEGVMLVSGVSSGPFKRLEVTFWWAAGGGKKPGE